MCGIVFVSREKGQKANNMIEKRYEAQKNRGTQGFGYVGLDKNFKVVSYERSETEEDIMKKLDGEKATTILFHHRMPTSTPNIVEASHPILVSSEMLDYDYYAVHNGIITNDDELKLKHEKMGFTYQTELTKQILTKKGAVRSAYTVFNDSEALAHELALVLDGEKADIEIKGSVAFIVLKVRKSDQQCISVHYGRNFSNPLKVFEIDKDYWTLTSEGDGVQIRANEIHTINFLTDEYSSEVKAIGEATKSWDIHNHTTPTTPTTGFDTTRTTTLPNGYDNRTSYGAERYSPMRNKWDRENEVKNLPIRYLPEDMQRPQDEEDDSVSTTYEEYLKDLYSEEDDLRQRLAKSEEAQDIDSFMELQAQLDDCIKVQKEIEEKYLNEVNADEMAEVYKEVTKDINHTLALTLNG